MRVNSANKSSNKASGLIPSSGKLFENLNRELMRPGEAAALLGISVKTIYDWKYRQSKRKIPKGLFLKFNRSLYLRADVLKQWFVLQNPSLNWDKEVN